MILKKRFAPAVKPPRAVLKEGWWLLRTVDPTNPAGPVMDPATGEHYPSLAAAMPQGWEEAFRDEYLPGAKRARGIRAHVSIFPHEIIVVDPDRRDVVLAETTRPVDGAVGVGTCIPVWVVPV